MASDTSLMLFWEFYSMEMPIFVPPTQALFGRWDASLRHAAPRQPDYTFPRIRVPRGQTIEHPDVRPLDGPAKSANIIKALRWLLVLDGFMTEAEAKQMTGHSMRHFLVTVARLLGYTQEEWNAELGVDQAGYRTLVNHGRDAHQEVMHLHIHILGGRPLGPMLEGGSLPPDGLFTRGA